MKTIKRLSTAILALLLCVCLTVPAYAATAFTYTAIAGGNTTFNKYLVMKSEANVPNVTFSYEIKAGEALAAGTDTLAVIPGPVVKTGDTVTKPSVGTAAFTTADKSSKLSTVASGDTVTLDAGESYVKKSVTIDFSGVTFPEPGVYRYILTEKETEGALGITYDTQKAATATAKQRTVDVYVTEKNDDTKTLEVSAYIVHYNVDNPKALTTATRLDDKSDGFVNEYATQNLSFAKTVTGNQGSKDKFFKFTLTISNAVPGTVYDVDLSNASASASDNAATKSEYQNQSNPTSITVPAADEGQTKSSVSVDFYLQHDQAITINGLAKGTTYNVTEVAEDYKSTEGTSKVAVAAQGTEGHPGYVAAKTYNDNPSGSIASDDIYTGYTNTRSGIVPTGVALTILPGVIIVMIAVAGIILIGKKKQRG